jgi:hypothetical protein
MTIRNLSGLPFQVAGSAQQFDPEGPEHAVFNLWDEELIRRTGAPIFYYEAYIQVHNTVDEMYWEDRGKLFCNIPVQLWALYEPVTQQNFQTVFGIDSQDELTFDLNYSAVLRDVGHPPKVGSRIYTPHKGENWEIVQRKLGEYKSWGEIRLQLVCVRFQESTTTGEGTITGGGPKPDFKIN